MSRNLGDTQPTGAQLTPPPQTDGGLPTLAVIIVNYNYARYVG